MMKLQRKLNNLSKYFKKHRLMKQIISKIQKIIMCFWKVSTIIISRDNKINRWIKWIKNNCKVQAKNIKKIQII